MNTALFSKTSGMKMQHESSHSVAKPGFYQPPVREQIKMRHSTLIVWIQLSPRKVFFSYVFDTFLPTNSFFMQSVRSIQRNRTEIYHIDVLIYRFIIYVCRQRTGGRFKELMIVETVKSETYRADQQPGNSDKNGCHSIEGEVLQETPVLSFKDFN